MIELATRLNIDMYWITTTIRRKIPFETESRCWVVTKKNQIIERSNLPLHRVLLITFGLYVT